MDKLLVTYLSNPHFTPDHRHPEPMLDESAGGVVLKLVDKVFDYQPTPLLALPSLAAQAGVASVQIKDEGNRLGLKSFKALGGAYAVIKLISAEAAETLGRLITLDELPRPASGSLDFRSDCGPDTAGSSDWHAVASKMTFACATDGNHGQSVAAGARLAGAKAVIFVHEGVSDRRRKAISRFGAELKVVAGNYDDAVKEAMTQAKQYGWTLLSDTSWVGYLDVPKWVMQGYTLMTHELTGQLVEPPTHVFLQAGVGGFAAAIASSLASTYKSSPPKIVIVEPSRAACLLASARADKVMKIDSSLPTVMSMLECYEASLFAWDLLRPVVTAFMTVEENDAVGAMRFLAYPFSPEEALVAGESGAAGLAGFVAAYRDPVAREALGLDASSRVLLFNTESATDVDRYTSLVGLSPAQIPLHNPSNFQDQIQTENVTSS